MIRNFVVLFLQQALQYLRDAVRKLRGIKNKRQVKTALLAADSGDKPDVLSSNELKLQLDKKLKEQSAKLQEILQQQSRSINEAHSAEIQELKDSHAKEVQQLERRVMKNHGELTVTNEELASQASVNELLRRTPAKGVPSSAKKGGGRSAADVRPMPPLPGDDSDNDE